MRINNLIHIHRHYAFAGELFVDHLCFTDAYRYRRHTLVRVLTSFRPLRRILYRCQLYCIPAGTSTLPWRRNDDL